VLGCLDLLALDWGQRKGNGEGVREEEFPFSFRRDVEGESDGVKGGETDLVELDGCFESLDGVFGGDAPPPPKYNFNLEEAVLPNCLFLFLAWSTLFEPMVDELHLDLRTLSCLEGSLVRS
jgi:hypothetical protein